LDFRIGQAADLESLQDLSERRGRKGDPRTDRAVAWAEAVHMTLFTGPERLWQELNYGMPVTKICSFFKEIRSD
jgi:hypothetical protein